MLVLNFGVDALLCRECMCWLHDGLFVGKWANSQVNFCRSCARRTRGV